MSIETDNGGKIYRNADINSEHYLSSVSGTLESPAELGNNQWGFSLTDPSTNNNKFSAVPTTKTDIKTTNTDTSSTPEGDKTAIYYGVKASDTLASGHYTGTVVYTITPSPECYQYKLNFVAGTNGAGSIAEKSIQYGDSLDFSKLSGITSSTGYHLTGWKDQDNNTYTTTDNKDPNPANKPSVTLTAQHAGNEYTIAYNGNGNTGGSMANTSATYGTAVTLRANAFTKTGYTFQGWATTQARANAGTVDHTDKKSVSNLTATQGSTVTLYAVWKAAAPAFFTITNMQDMTSAICATATTPAKTATTSDTTGAYHGNTSYVPTKTLKDTRDNNTYTVKKLADGNCWMTQNLRIVGSRTLTSSDSDVSSNYSLPAAQTSAFTNSSNNNQVGAVQSSYGNGAYYSWYAATAGTGTDAVYSGKATSSICPKGWQLPLKDGTKSYYNLITTTYGIENSAAGSTALQAQPLQFVLAGGYVTSGLIDGGSVGYYWSSSVNDAWNVYALTFASSGVSHQHNYRKYFGFSVRCVAR